MPTRRSVPDVQSSDSTDAALTQSPILELADLAAKLAQRALVDVSGFESVDRDLVECTDCGRRRRAGEFDHGENCLTGRVLRAGDAARNVSAQTLPSQDRLCLTFDGFQAINRKRCEEKFHPLSAWLPGGWPLAICGEAGELANIAKKVVRGDFSLGDKREEMVKDLADVITYCDLMLSALGVRTVDALYSKFEEVSARVGFEMPRKEGIVTVRVPEDDLAAPTVLAERSAVCGAMRPSDGEKYVTCDLPIGHEQSTPMLQHYNAMADVSWLTGPQREEAEKAAKAAPVPQADGFSGAPSAEDLDRVAEENAVRLATLPSAAVSRRALCRTSLFDPQTERTLICTLEPEHGDAHFDEIENLHWPQDADPECVVCSAPSDGSCVACCAPICANHDSGEYSDVLACADKTGCELRIVTAHQKKVRESRSAAEAAR